MLKRTHILFIALCALCVNQALTAQIFFGDVDQDFPLYDSSDPFGIIAATNAQALSVSANNTAAGANALGVTATNNAAVALALGVTATNDAANAVALSVTATNNAQTALTLSVTATNQSALATSAAQSVTNTAAVALALSISATNTAATALALGVTATNLSSTANAISVTATNSSETALALAITATNTASTANALGVTATNAAATANALAATATNDSATALALSVTATNAASEAAYQSGIAYLYATNAAAQAAGVYTPATNAAAVAALAWSRANLAYTLAGSVYGYSTNAIDIATNASAQVATAYPAATNALVQATNATAVSASAYSLASNAWDTATNAYVTATNAQHRVGLAETNKADRTELANYETVDNAQIVAAVALDAYEQAEMAVKTNDVRWLAAIDNKISKLHDPHDSNVWFRIEGGTNLVGYRFTGLATNLSVSYSEGFFFTNSVTHETAYPPEGGTFPFASGAWTGRVSRFNGKYEISYNPAGHEYYWLSGTADLPADLIPDGVSTFGTATVSVASIDYPATNEFYRGDIGALTGTVVITESDLAALRLYHYGSPDIIESPAEWFQFDGAGIITGINAESVTNWNIVIPWEIGGVPVTEIGVNAFTEISVTSIVGAGNVVKVGALAFSDCASLASVSLPQVQTVGSSAFDGCFSLASVSLPQVQTVGDSAFYGCASLASVSLPQVQTVGSSAFELCGSLTSFYFDNDGPTIGADIFANITTNQVTNYVMSATATGWDAMLGGMPVVRLPLHTDALTLGGVTHTNWPSADVSGLATTQSVAAVAGALDAAQSLLSNHTSNGTIGSDGHLQTGDRALIDSVPGLATTQSVAAVAQEIAAIEFPVASTNYTAWTGTITPANGTATVSIAHGNQPVLVIDAPTVLQLDATGFGTSGVSRVSLSYYTGTNSLTFATNVITYAETPPVDTNGWNTLLLRRVSDGAWKGVGL